MHLDQYHGRPHCSLTHEDLPGTQGHGQDARLVSETTFILLLNSFLTLALFVWLFSPDGEVIITNDGATILEKMEVSFFAKIQKDDAQVQWR